MSRAVLFHYLAERELKEALEYYAAISPELGSIFLDDVDYAIAQVVEFPESAALVNRIVRRKLLRRFPYSVLYSVRRDVLRILAIANQKRRPFYWRERI